MDDAVETANLCLIAAEATADKVIELKTDLGGFSAMVLARASQALNSATVLAHAGLVGDAMSVTRTIVELDIDYAYITTNPTEFIPKFRDYDDVTGYRMA